MRESSVQCSKSKLKNLYDQACQNLDLSRQDLAERLGVNAHNLYGYVQREVIPKDILTELKKLSGTSSGKRKSSLPSLPETVISPEPIHFQVSLASLNTEVLIQEIERRGWSVVLKRNPNPQL